MQKGEKGFSRLSRKVSYSGKNYYRFVCVAHIFPFISMSVTLSLHPWLFMSVYVLIYTCTFVCIYLCMCVQLYILCDRGALSFSGRQIETERHYGEPRTSVFYSVYVCVRVHTCVCVRVCAKAHSSLTNYVIFMHDLARDFKHTHTRRIIKLSGCCLLPSALPMTTESHQHSHLTFCCCSNHRLTICQKDKKKANKETDRVMGVRQ